jgi:hypothetical protein
MQGAQIGRKPDLNSSKPRPILLYTMGEGWRGNRGVNRTCKSASVEKHDFETGRRVDTYTGRCNENKTSIIYTTELGIFSRAWRKRVSLRRDLKNKRKDKARIKCENLVLGSG